MSFRIQIITPVDTIFEADVDSATVETDSGVIQLLSNHVQILTQASAALVKVETNLGSELIFINGGIAEFDQDNKLVINTTFGIIVGLDSDSFKKYLTDLEATKVRINDLQSKALAVGQYFEQSQIINNYLFDEERLAKFELYQEMLRSR